MEQFFHFFVAGGFSALLDLLLFNYLTRPPRSWNRVRSSTFSTACCMFVSYGLNRSFVFNSNSGMLVPQGAKFFLVTAVACFVIQNLVILGISKAFAVAEKNAVFFGHHLRNGGIEKNSTFLYKNVAKVAGMSAAMIWNFFWYRSFVFG